MRKVKSVAIYDGVDMFVGRDNEIGILNEFLASDSAKALLLYGKRRVGKTELIRQTFKQNNRSYVYYECSKDTLENNINAFVDALVSNGVLRVKVSAKTFEEVFYYISLEKSDAVIVIDEYPYLSEYCDKKIIDSYFQKIIDNHLGKNKLILTGSNISIMSSLLEENNALFGRFDKYLLLNELDYYEAKGFYEDKSAYDSLAFYSIFGGSPFVNKEIDSSVSLKENIIKTFLNQTSNVYSYCKYILFTDTPSSININAICNILKNGKNSCTEIENSLNANKNGGLNKKLAALVDMNILSKVCPINKLGNNKLTKYEISDNAIRFYYTYVYPFSSILNTIGAEAFYAQYIEKSLTTYTSYRFEAICRQYFSRQIKSGGLKNVVNIGTYYYDDQKNKQNGEFDIALQMGGGKYKIYEAKYYEPSSPLSLLKMQEEEKKIAAINQIAIDSFGFISTSGCEMQGDYECIDASRFY